MENYKNKIIDCKEHYKICVYNREQKIIGKVKIDKDDLEKVKNYRWWLDSNSYVQTKINKKNIYLHQLILGKKEGFEIDHCDRDTLNNQKYNLRFATRQENIRNRKCKGYTFYKPLNKLVARIIINGKYIHLGYFNKKEDAINARLQAEKKYFGEFFRYKI